MSNGPLKFEGGTLSQYEGHAVVRSREPTRDFSVILCAVYGVLAWLSRMPTRPEAKTEPISVPSIEVSDNIARGAQPFDGRRSESLARKRYQKGSLYLRKGKHRRVWVGRWLEDVIENGQVRRVHRREVLGTLKDFPTEKLARRELDARLAAINSVSYRPRPAATFAEFRPRWENTVLTQHKPSTQATIRSQIRKYLVPFFGDYQMRAIQTEDLQRFLSGVRASPKTVRNLSATFQMMWKSARAWGYVANDVTVGIVLPKKRRPRTRSFTLEEVQRIFSAGDFCVWPRKGKRTVLIKAEPYRTFYWLAAETGLRAGELCGLRVCDLALQAGRLEVRQSVWRGRVQSPKTENAYRTLALSSDLVEHLGKFVLKLTPNERGLLFVTRNGTPWDANLLVRRQLRPLLSALGIAPGGLHAFRHANASLMDRLRVPVKVRQERLGQSDPRMTLGVYTHVASEDDFRIASQLGKIISGGVSCPVLPN